MTIVAVSDTNIFIDLLETSLLEKLFHLPGKSTPPTTRALEPITTSGRMESLSTRSHIR